MAAGTLVVASNATLIPAMDSNTALYFEPTDASRAAELLVRVLRDPQLAEELRKKGREQALRLDWELHFERLCIYYRAVAAANLRPP